MKFTVNLAVSGYLRSAILEGRLTKEDFDLYNTLNDKEKEYMLQEHGEVIITSYKINDYDIVGDVEWTN